METYNQTAFPPLGLYDPETLLLKNAHEAFDVYVNDEYIGKKIMVTQTEEVSDIASFLKKQGVKSVSTNVEGDHYIITTDESERVKNIIEGYLKNR